MFTYYLFGCTDQKNRNDLIFATSAEYPPFEYRVSGKLIGFEIELAKLIAGQLGKKAQFQDMQFNAILPAVQSGIVDAAISTITITAERKKNFGFSVPYYLESMAVIFHKNVPIENQSDLMGKKIACQIGTTMEIWLKKHTKDTEIITMDNNPQAIEMLKAGYVDKVLIDTAQANTFAEKNHELAYKVIAQADSGYGIAFKKGSSLAEQVNKALRTLESNGEIEKLKKKYLEIK